MKIEMLNKNKLKIMFDYIELEENHISLHSFLSNSVESQNFFLAILDIANEDFGFNKNNSNLTFETISFDNKFFVIIVTKTTNYSPSFALNNTTTLIFEKAINNQNEFLYKLRDVQDLFNFCDDLKKFLPIINFDSSLYQYNNMYFLKIIFESTDSEKIKTILLISELKDSLNLSKLALTRFNEFSELIIAHNAVQVL